MRDFAVLNSGQGRFWALKVSITVNEPISPPKVLDHEVSDVSISSDPVCAIGAVRAIVHRMPWWVVVVEVKEARIGTTVGVFGIVVWIGVWPVEEGRQVSILRDVPMLLVSGLVAISVVDGVWLVDENRRDFRDVHYFGVLQNYKNSTKEDKRYIFKLQKGRVKYHLFGILVRICLTKLLRLENLII